MNERIKQLAKEADDYTDTYCETVALSYSNWNSIRDEKFTKLIVQECIKMVETEASQYAEPVWAFELVNDMYEQFGIKQ